MICLKGCKKEIGLLNELLSKEIKEKNVLEQELHKALVQVNKATDTLLVVNNRVKELESALLRFENINKPPEIVKGIGTYYNDPVSGEPLFSPDFVGEVFSTSKYPAKKKKK